MPAPVLMLTNMDRKFCRLAAKITQIFIQNCQIVNFSRDTLNSKEIFNSLDHDSYPAVISFLCPAIVPKALLKKSRLNVNFHPGNANYPGIGSFNFALYEGVAEYGACCHHMAAKVDTGGIIYEENFPIAAEETVETLQVRTWMVLLELLSKFLRHYAAGEREFEADLKGWTRQPFTRRELNSLAILKRDMSEDEIARRKKACNYPGFSVEFETDRQTEKNLAEKPKLVPLVERLFE